MTYWRQESHWCNCENGWQNVGVWVYQKEKNLLRTTKGIGSCRKPWLPMTWRDKDNFFFYYWTPKMASKQLSLLICCIIFRHFLRVPHTRIISPSQCQNVTSLTWWESNLSFSVRILMLMVSIEHWLGIMTKPLVSLKFTFFIIII